MRHDRGSVEPLSRDDAADAGPCGALADGVPPATAAADTGFRNTAVAVLAQLHVVPQL